MFFNPQQQSPMFQGGQGLPPEIMQMLMQMQQGGGQPQQPQMPAQMPPGGMNHPNVPQQGLMPGQMPMAGAGPSSQMNPLASILGNHGGAMSPQGGMNQGSAAGGGGMGGLMQIINAMKSQQQVNGQQPASGAPGGVDISAIINAMRR